MAVSLAFFLSPIFTVVAALLIFGEKLTKRQWITFIICILAVAGYGFATGELPWLALVIATAFAGYGVVMITIWIAIAISIPYEQLKKRQTPDKDLSLSSEAG